jgi:hypothetical protein
MYLGAHERSPSNLPKAKETKSINRQNQSTTGKLGKRHGPDLVQAFPRKWWVESDLYLLLI